MKTHTTMRNVLMAMTCSLVALTTFGLASSLLTGCNVSTTSNDAPTSDQRARLKVTSKVSLDTSSQTRGAAFILLDDERHEEYLVVIPTQGGLPVVTKLP